MEFDSDDPAQQPGQAHEFFQVARLIPVDQKLLIFAPDTRVDEALRQMRDCGFDQVPVCGREHVLGIFSYRSFAQWIQRLKSPGQAMECEVADFLDAPEFVTARSSMKSVLEIMDRLGWALVGQEDNLLAIISPVDVANFLWSISEPFILLQDIELAMRSLMVRACIDVDELRHCIARVVKPTEKRPSPERLDDLSYNELFSVLEHGENLGRVFNRTFGKHKDLFAPILKPVGEIRNKTFHFRDDVSIEDLELLAKAKGWLEMKARRAEAT